MGVPREKGEKSMGKREHLDEGWHEIKNKRRPKVRKDREKGPRLKTKRKMRRSTKIATLCLVVSLLICAYSFGLAFFRDPSRNSVNLDYGSVSREVENGEVYSAEGGYSPIDIFARLNWTFSRQKRWYSEMHGVVDTVIQQEIETYKQYNDGILISADLTRSSLVSGASQFCYLKNEDLVMWRKPVGGASTYNGLGTEWKTGEPYRMMTISGEDGFKATNGLPAYELSVYVIEEETVLQASEVTMTEDGLYKITYDLRPDTWQEEDENGAIVTKGATAYYANQMIFTGGLPEAPVFDAISVSFTYDRNWRVHTTEIRESYNAKYGPIAAACVSTSKTEYEYDTDRAVSDAYENYFKQYVNSPVENHPTEKEVTALNCLAEAFGCVLTEPTSLNVDLTLNDRPVKGVVNLDLGGMDLSALDLTAVEAKAKIGALRLWVQDGTAYVNYGGLKFRVGLDELISLFGDAVQPAEGEDSDLLGALAGGEFTVDGDRAELSSRLPLGDFELPVRFVFRLDEAKTASLECVTTEFSIQEKLTVGAKLTFGDEILEDLEVAEEYADILPYARSLAELFGGETLHVTADYEAENVSIGGGFDLRIQDGFALSGELTAELNLQGITLKKTVTVGYLDGVIYLELDGIKLRADTEEAMALLSWYLDLPSLSVGETDLSEVLCMLLSEEFAGNFSSTESENTLVLLVEGTELLRSFGADFELGEVKLALREGELSAEALGAKISVQHGEPFSVDTEGFISILPYAEDLISLFGNDYLRLGVSYTAEEIGLSVTGQIDLNPATAAAKGAVTLSYQSFQKTFDVQYAAEKVYLAADELKICVPVKDAADLLIKELNLSAEDTPEAKELLNRVLAMNFGELLSLKESGDALSVLIHGTKLLDALGIGFEAGEIELRISDARIDVTAFGAELSLVPGEAFALDTEGYLDVLPYAKELIGLFKNDVLALRANYSGEALSIAADLSLDLKTLTAAGTLGLDYNSAHKDIGVIYKDGGIYLSIDGLKISAKVDEAIALVGQFMEIPESDGESKDLLKEILTLNFSELVQLSEENDTLTAAVNGTMLLNLFGLDFDLGTATVKVSEGKVDVEVLGAQISITAGKPFDVDTTGYIDIVKYAATVIEMIQGGILRADVSYETENLVVAGVVDFEIASLTAKAKLILTYKEVSKTAEIIYKENAIYLTLDGLKISAKVDEAVALVEQFMEIPESDGESKDLLKEILSLDFGEFVQLSEENDILTAAVDGPMLLNLFGLDFDLGTSTVKVSEGKIDVEALGAHITVTAGEPFEADTTGYIDIVKYAATVIEMIQGGYLTANVNYTTENKNLTVAGTVDFEIASLTAKAELTLTYKEVSKTAKIIYKDNAIYLTIDGLKISAKVDEAIALVGQFMEIPESDGESKDLLKEILSLNFGDLVNLSEENDILTAAVNGTALLNLFGLDFDLGTATVQISEDRIDVSALGAQISITAGEPFSVETDGYIDIVKYAATVIEMIQGGVLKANVSYTTENKNLAVTGTVDFEIKSLTAKATLTLTYQGASKTAEIIYKDGEIFLAIDGLKISAKVDEAIALVGQFMEIPESDGESKDLLKEILSLNFGDLVNLSEENDTLTATVNGTALLNLFGLDFDLKTATVQISEGKIDVEVLGAHITVTAGEPFDADTTGYIDIVKYAATVIEMIQGGTLRVGVSYETENLAVTGTVDFEIESLTAKAELTLTYKEVSKTAKIIYKNGEIFLAIDGLKISAKVEEAIALVKQVMGVSESDKESRDLLKEILSLNFGELVQLSEENDTLTAAVDGTALLNLFGLDFDLGKATVQFSEGKIDVEALGAHITVTAGKPFSVETTGYIDIVKYAATVIEMIQGGVLKANVSYTTENGNLSVTGTVDFEIESLTAKAILTLTYQGASKTAEIIYKDNVIYLAIDGLKISAKLKEEKGEEAEVEEAVELVGQSIGVSESDEESKDLLKEILSLDFGKLVQLSEKDNTLTAAVNGTALLNLFGLDFDLGTATVQISEGRIDVEALGAHITVTAGEPFEADTTGYIDIVKYAVTVIEMIQGDVLRAGVNYETENLAVAGAVDFEIASVTAKAKLMLTYQGVSKTAEVIYKENAIFLAIDGLKISAKIEEAIALVGKIMDIPESDEESKDLLKEILSLDFGKLVQLSESEENDTLTAAVNGTMLLNLFGLNFNFGTATVKISDGKIDVDALGAHITVTAGEPFDVETDGYLDIMPVAKKIAEIVSAKAITLRGVVTVKVNEEEIALEIRNGTISWAEGFKFYLDATLSAGGTAHDLKLYADSEKVKIVYGETGAELVFADLDDLEEKFLDVYERLREIVGKAIVTKDGGNPLPKADSLSELLQSVLGKIEDTASKQGSESLAQLLEALKNSGLLSGAADGLAKEEIGKKIDFSKILNELMLASLREEQGRIVVSAKGLELGLDTNLVTLDETLPKMLRADVSYSGENFSLKRSTLYLCAPKSFPEMPEIPYLGFEDYCELLDFLGATAQTLAEEDVGLSLSGQVLSTAPEYRDAGGVQYTFDATVNYFSGTETVNGKKVGKFPFTINLQNKSVSVNSDLYLKVHLTLESKVEECLYLDLYIMDMDPSGKSDGKLDFFVSISKYKSGDPNYQPLSFYAPASEVKSLLSAACILLGVDNEIVRDFLIETGLTAETREELQAIGDSLQLGSIISGLIGGNEEKEPAIARIAAEETLKKNYLKQFAFAPERGEEGKILGNTLSVVLNGPAIYGNADAKDLEITLQKEGESFVSSHLTGVNLQNVTAGEKTVSLDLDFTYEKVPDSDKKALSVTYNFDGLERLISSIAKSATHDATNEEIISGEAEEHDYVLNKTYYIDGKANVSALLFLKAEVKIIAISVTIDEENKVAVNLRLEYDGIVGVINGHSTVDITIKDGMVYMKRVQTTYYEFHLFQSSWPEYDTPITIYRVTTLDNFFTDILKHLGYLLNLTETIQNQIDKTEPAQPQDTTSTDYGSLVSKYLSGYSCTHQEGGKDTWTVKMNGNELTDGVLSEIGITFTADPDDIVRDLHVSTSLYSFVNLELDLNWKNPRSAKNYTGDRTDKTFADKLADEENGIGAGLKIHDFTQESFVEFVEGTIGYSYRKYNGGGTESLGSAHIYYKTNDKKLLNEPKAPDLKKYDDGHEFYLEWDAGFCHVGSVLPDNAQNTATQKPYLYDVTFVTDKEQAGDLTGNYSWQQSGEKSTFTAKMKYNSQVKFSANGKEVKSQKITQNETIVLPKASDYKDGAAGIWNLDSFTIEEAQFTAFYPLTVRYISVIAYNASSSHPANTSYDVEVKDSDYTLIQPTANGYTFLGWFTKDGGDWREAKEISSTTVIDGKLTLEVEALWMSDFSIAIEANRTSKWLTFTHTIKGTISGGQLVGAFANEATVSTEYKFYVDNDQNYTEGKKDAGKTFNNYTKSYTDSSIKNSVLTTAPCAHVVATLTFRCGDIIISRTAHNFHFYR